MKILLTGYKGFIGQHMHKALIQAGHDVECYEWGDTYPGVMDKDWVIHMGAISSTTETDIDKVLRQNYDFSVSLFEDCKTFGVPFQFSSSAGIYGQTIEFKETSKPDPRSPYAWSKYLFERYAWEHRGGCILQMFRYFNVYSTDGESERHKGGQASPHFQFTEQAKNKKEITIFEDSDRARRDFIHVDQVVDTQMKFFKVRDSGVFNLGTGKTSTFQTVAKSIAKAYNVPIKVVPMPENIKKHYQWYTKADMTKTNETLAKYDRNV